jgi:hypothetical protein
MLFQTSKTMMRDATGLANAATSRKNRKAVPLAALAGVRECDIALDRYGETSLGVCCLVCNCACARSVPWLIQQLRVIGEGVEGKVEAREVHCRTAVDAKKYAG